MALLGAGKTSVVSSCWQTTPLFLGTTPCPGPWLSECHSAPTPQRWEPLQHPLPMMDRPIGNWTTINPSSIMCLFQVFCHNNERGKKSKEYIISLPPTMPLEAIWGRYSVLLLLLLLLFKHFTDKKMLPAESWGLQVGSVIPKLSLYNFPPISGKILPCSCTQGEPVYLFK